jgi:hypothetical protein
LLAAPFLRVWENYAGGLPPKELPYSPEVAGRVIGTRFSQNLDLMATVSNYRRADVAGIGNPSTPVAQNAAYYFSPDDNYVLMGGDATVLPVVLPALFKRRGPYYMPVDVGALPLPSSAVVTRAALSKGGTVIAVSTSDAPNDVKVYLKNGALETWALATTLHPNTDSGADLSASPLKIADDASFLFVVGGFGLGSMYVLTSGVYTAAGPTATTASWIRDVVKRTNGDWWALLSDTALGFKGPPQVWGYIAGVWTAIDTTLTFPVANGVEAVSSHFAHGGEIVVFTVARNTTFGSSADQEKSLGIIHAYNGTDYTLITEYSVIPGGAICLLVAEPKVSPDGNFIAVGCRLSSSAGGHTRPIYVYQCTGGVGTSTVTLLHTFTSPGDVGQQTFQPYGFSPDNSVLHAQWNGSGGAADGNFHLNMVTPWANNNPMKEAPGVDSKLVTIPVYSPHGQVAFTLTPGGLVATVKDGSGNYIDMTVLEGTFISLWDRIAGGEVGQFAERNFIQHPLNTVITDLLFSPGSHIFTYHAERPGDPDQTGLGRYIYDIHIPQFISYRGVIRNAGDLASLLAFHPAETHFVTVFKNAGGNNIQLSHFTNSIYDFTHLDTDGVEYGPPAFSPCEVVIVAHGGDQPYSAFNHLSSPDSLVEQTLPIMDWDETSNINAVVFTPDCDGLIIVTDDNIQIRDPAGGGVLDEQPAEVPDPQILPDPDDPSQIIIAPSNGGGGGGGGGDGGPSWGVDVPSKTVDNLSYLPFVSISVTFRTWR